MTDPLVKILRDVDEEFGLAKTKRDAFRRHRETSRNPDPGIRRAASKKIAKARIVAAVGIDVMKHMMEMIPENRKYRGLPRQIGPWIMVYRPDWPDNRIAMYQGGKPICTEFLNANE